MPPVLKVNGRDLSAFLRLQPDEGGDLTDVAYLTPQFGGAPALTEGGVFVANTARNKEWTVPLWARSQATGAQGVNDVIKAVNLDLQRGPASVEFQPEGASQSTFFDLEQGRMDPSFSHFHHRRGWAKADLKLWTKPYGHTASARPALPSTISSAMLGPGLYNLTGIQGDARALANVHANRLGPTAFLMYAFSPLPSYHPFVGASTLAFGTTVTSATAIGSTFRSFAALTGGALGGLFLPIATIPLSAQGYAGRNRIFAIAGHQFSGTGGSGVQLRLTLAADGRVLTRGTSLIKSVSTHNWCLVDLGEVTVPSQVPGAAPVGTMNFNVEYGHNYPTYLATHPLRFNGFIVLPLDHSAGFVVSETLGGQANNFSFRSWPERQVTQNGAGVGTVTGMGPSGIAQRNAMIAFRGELPKLPEGSRTWFMGYGGRLDANDVLGFSPVATTAWQVDVLERFRFFR